MGLNETLFGRYIYVLAYYLNVLNFEEFFLHREGLMVDEG